MASEVIQSLESLCQNADIALGRKFSDMGNVIEIFAPSGKKRRRFLEIGNPQGVYPPKMHQVMTWFRGKFIGYSGLDDPRMKRHLKHLLPNLLLDILLGENEVLLLERNWDEIFPDEKDVNHKYFHDLRHELFMKEDMVSKAMRNDHNAFADLNRRYVANAEFCRGNPHKFALGYYETASFLVALAGAYYNVIDTGLHNADIEYTKATIDSFIDALQKAAESSRGERGSVPDRIRNLCVKSLGEFREHGIDGYKEFAGQIRYAQSIVTPKKHHRSRHPRAGEGYQGRKRGF